MLYSRLANPEQAVNYLTKAKENYKKNRVTEKKELVMLYKSLATAQHHIKNYNDAIVNYEEAIALHT